MTKESWFEVVKEQCETVGTNLNQYAPVMETLATILAQRDKAFDEFLETGGESCISTGSAAKPLSKNPRLLAWYDLNAQALAYWREMCLTPASLKKLSERNGSGSNTLEKLLQSI